MYFIVISSNKVLFNIVFYYDMLCFNPYTVLCIIILYKHILHYIIMILCYINYSKLS